METIPESSLLGQEHSEETKKNIATPDLVFEWRKHYLKEGHSVASTTTYFNYIKSFVGYGIEINQKNINTFRTKSSSGSSSGSLKNFFQFLVNKKEFPQEILYIHFDKSKSKKKFPESLDIQEVNKLIEAMPRLKDKYFTIVLSSLGLRISEGLKLKFEDFSWSSWLLDRTKQGSVNLKNTKGGRFRTIPVSPELMELLYSDNVCKKTSEGIPIGNLIFDYGIMEFLNNKEHTLDENQYDYLKYAGDRYRDILERTSKNVLNKKVHPHQFRHSRAQDLMNRGLPIESLRLYLGHSNLSSTSIYASASAEKLKEDMSNLRE